MSRSKLKKSRSGTPHVRPGTEPLLQYEKEKTALQAIILYYTVPSYAIVCSAITVQEMVG